MDPTSHVSALQRRQAGSKSGSSSNSLSSVISTLVPVLVVSLIIFALFLLIRPRVARVYQARTLNIVHKEDRIDPQKPGLFGWVTDYRRHDDITVLQRNSFDAYLILRYFKLMVLVCLLGCCITWPILFPVNATGGKGQTELDILSISNVKPGPRFFAHALVAWVFLGAVVFLICRERLMFVGLRQAYSTSPFHGQRLSARTLLILHIPAAEATEPQLRQLFGSTVRRVWIASDCSNLEDMVTERDKAAAKLEGAQVKLIKAANAPKAKSSSQGIDPKSRPTHRLKPLIGKKVDTIDWAQSFITKRSLDIEKERKDVVIDQSTNKSAAFIEFVTQAAAQEALLSTPKKTPHKTAPRYIGVQPGEIIWKNLGMKFPVRKIKELIAVAIITAMILYWTPIIAFAGAISKIDKLIETAPFLSFIEDIPSQILGVVTGLLPVIVIAVVMLLPPIIARLLAKQFAPTLSQVELKCQKWYFAFQVVQVFLVATIGSAAAEVVPAIIDDQSKAATLLAENLPKASTLYMSYFILQGLTGASMMLLALVPLLLYALLGILLDKTPRKKFNRWVNLAGLGWGSVYPKFSLLGVIAITYSCIAPLVMGFATVGLFLIYLALRYAFIFVLGTKIDMKGDAYAMALQQLLTGVYLSALCLIGLFGIGSASSTDVAGPLVLMVVFLVLLLIFHILFNVALRSLESTLQLEILAEMRQRPHESSGYTKTMEEGHSLHATDGNYTNNGANIQHHGAGPDLRTGEKTSHGFGASLPASPKLNFLARRLKPLVWGYYAASKSKVGRSFTPEYTPEEAQESYLNPALSSHPPVIWLPRDTKGISRMFVTENREKGLASSDHAARMNDKNKLEWDRDHPETAPIWTRRVVY